ncbi:unnamed protein product [Cylicocyclus nassatus]|uniref:Uncharacterized protein n=1 Tax=Cylicocyclus nassatus TaxID=53992 RepID=A0AA36HG39_CYLNA|nr:unnamed protein product [Cylicocyclus nassatus]
MELEMRRSAPITIRAPLSLLVVLGFAHISEQEESSPDSSELRCRKIAFNFVRHSYGLMRMDLTPKCIRKRRAQGPLTLVVDRERHEQPFNEIVENAKKRRRLWKTSEVWTKPSDRMAQMRQELGEIAASLDKPN